MSRRFLLGAGLCLVMLAGHAGCAADDEDAPAVEPRFDLAQTLRGNPDPSTLRAAELVQAALDPAELKYLGLIDWSTVTADGFLKDPIIAKAYAAMKPAIEAAAKTSGLGVTQQSLELKGDGDNCGCSDAQRALITKKIADYAGQLKSAAAAGLATCAVFNVAYLPCAVGILGGISLSVGINIGTAATMAIISCGFDNVVSGACAAPDPELLNPAARCRAESEARGELVVWDAAKKMCVPDPCGAEPAGQPHAVCAFCNTALAVCPLYEGGLAKCKSDIVYDVSAKPVDCGPAYVAYVECLASKDISRYCTYDVDDAGNKFWEIEVGDGEICPAERTAYRTSCNITSM